MKSSSIFLTILALLLSQLCCCNGNGDEVYKPPSENESTENPNNNGDTSQAIGTVWSLRNLVQAGPSSYLEEVENRRDLQNNDAIKVTGNGKARLEFPGPLKLLLYKDSEVQGITTGFGPGSNPRIISRLVRGGMSGYVAPGQTLTLDLAFGVEVNVLGTSFFVIHNEETGVTTIGKFDGTLAFIVPGQNEILLDSEIVDIAADGTTTYFHPIPFTLEEFEAEADNSAIDGMNRLREIHQIPFPGSNPQPAEAPQTVMRALVKREGDNYVPDLAASWEVDPDGYEWFFHIREGVFLSDGSPFTSSTVYERLTQEWTYADGDVEIELIDDYTIRFFLVYAYGLDMLDEMSQFPYEVMQ